MPHKPPDQDDSAKKLGTATSRAVRLLCHKARSAAELVQVLAKEGFGEADQQQALAAVRAWGYVHDDRLAEAVGASALRRGRGTRWLQQQLATRQVKGPVTHALAERHEKEEPALIAELLERRFAGKDLQKDPRQKARAVRFLLGRGFAYGHVATALRRHGAHIDDAYDPAAD